MMAVMSGTDGGCESTTGADATVTVAEAVTLPETLVAVSLYVVVFAGETVRDVLPVTVPTPLSIVTEVAPLTLHDNVADWPAVMDAGVAAKLTMAGAAGPEGGGDVTGESTTPPKSVVQYQP